MNATNTMNATITPKAFNREEAEEWLIDNDFEYIMDGDGIELLRDYLSSGFKGYSYFTDAELKVEIEQRKENDDE